MPPGPYFLTPAPIGLHTHSGTDVHQFALFVRDFFLSFLLSFFLYKINKLIKKKKKSLTKGPVKDIGSSVGMQTYRGRCKKVGSGGHIWLYPVPTSTMLWRCPLGLGSCEFYVCVRLSIALRLHEGALGLRPSMLGDG